MICISIAQESRRMALVDMLNAAGQCDLLEVRLDRFGKAPELGDLLTAKPKPVIMSCRRGQDGGNWEGTETERLTLLRQCVISKADYVEIELDVADQIRRLPPTKRVISYTNLRETPSDIANIYAEAQTKGADVIKLVTLARTPEEGWPLVQILAKATVPTVLVGLGKPGVLLTLLGKKLGAPWTYAALEKGMEAYPGEPTVRELEDVYHYRSIARTTRFVGVTGFSELEYLTTAVLNAALGELRLDIRGLPLQIGSLMVFRKLMDAVKLAGVIVDPEHRIPILDVATHLEPSAEQAQSADLVISKDKGWHGYNTFLQAAVAALENAVGGKGLSGKPLDNRMVVIVGINTTARILAAAVQRLGGAPILASRNRAAAHELAQTLGCRFVPFEALYSTMHDILIVCHIEKEQMKGKLRPSDTGDVHSGYLKPGMTVMDLTTMPLVSPLLRDAHLRGCRVVSPRQVLLEQLAQQVRLLTGMEPPRAKMEEVMTRLEEEGS